MIDRKWNRRQFIRRMGMAAAGGGAVAAAGGPVLVPASALGLGGVVAPSERIALGMIGMGGRGSMLQINFQGLTACQVVAVCDVKTAQREYARQVADQAYGGTGCRAFVDFRDLCARPDIDAVAIATPDHWHVLQALEALRAGKDVYMEKPLGLSVAEGKALRGAVERHGRVLQFGTQERSSRNSRFACEMVLSGRIGAVHTIRVGSRQSVPSGVYPPMPVPDGIDYDLWLGPAPWAPYTDHRVINEWWFHNSDYSLGFISGCGVHTVDIAQWGNGTQLTGPVAVEGWGTFPADGLNDCATAWEVTMTYANGVKMHFTDGEQNPLGVRFEGTDGWVFVKEEHLGGAVDAWPREMLRQPIGPGEVRLPFSNHHQENFLDCIRTRARPVAPVEVAVRSDTLCQLSDIAMRLGRRLRWDPDAETFVGDAEANRMLSRAMRSPWRL